MVTRLWPDITQFFHIGLRLNLLTRTLIFMSRSPAVLLQTAAQSNKQIYPDKSFLTSKPVLPEPLHLSAWPSVKSGWYTFSHFIFLFTLSVLLFSRDLWKIHPAWQLLEGGTEVAWTTSETSVSLELACMLQPQNLSYFISLCGNLYKLKKRCNIKIHFCPVYVVQHHCIFTKDEWFWL